MTDTELRLIWIDITTYSRNDTKREPNVWHARAGALRLVLVRNHRHAEPGVWAGTLEPIQPLRELGKHSDMTLEQAQLEMERSAREAVEEMRVSLAIQMAPKELDELERNVWRLQHHPDMPEGLTARGLESEDGEAYILDITDYKDYVQLDVPRKELPLKDVTTALTTLLEAFGKVRDGEYEED